ncbi:MAG: CHAD domain-containing protein [Isosphaeraceae bacterium]|nr:CHAD domain-containing protein [Isosphaeraceae bacterium]
MVGTIDGGRHPESEVGGAASTPLGPEVPLQVPAVSPRDPSSLAIRAALSADVLRLLMYEPAAQCCEPEGVHQMRATIRRLRSDLRTFRPLLNTAWAEGFRGDLRWLAGLLGAVRDLDVLRARLQQAAAGLDPGALCPLFRALEQRHAAARDALRSGLQSDRYRGLRSRLIEMAGHPVTTARAEAPCRVALPSLVAAAWKALKRPGRRLRPGDAEERYHRVRILAKRVRYAAEAVAPALGRQARHAAERFARRAARVQGILGEHQDAVMAGRAIAAIIAEYPLDQPSRCMMTRLWNRQHRAAQEARARFPTAWERLDRKKVRRWTAG